VLNLFYKPSNYARHFKKGGTMKNLLTVSLKLAAIQALTFGLVMLASQATLAQDASGIDISSLTQGATLGTGINEAQVKEIIASEKVYCLRVNSKNYLASVGALRTFKKTITSTTKSVACSDKVIRQSIADSVEFIQLSKSKMTPEAYNKLSAALIKGFGV
jgi:hypothetical protein